MFALGRLRLSDIATDLGSSLDFLCCCVNFCYNNAREHPLLRNTRIEQHYTAELGILPYLGNTYVGV